MAVQQLGGARRRAPVVEPDPQRGEQRLAFGRRVQDGAEMGGDDAFGDLGPADEEHLGKPVVERRPVTEMLSFFAPRPGGLSPGCGLRYRPRTPWSG
ncbi:hypothetical protein [Streptomyces sp. NBC_01320]|uniref:hypothetical protein n=1 Tax=Streptomyces sp. NBC_01320 TaxID=2903824 RepID=UPI002E0FAC6E|nr:hypothetical protein OG395_20450 [Streptomyces sp. NBC_01320]